MIFIRQAHLSLLDQAGLVAFEDFWEGNFPLFKKKKDRAIYRLEIEGQFFFLKRYFPFPFWRKNEARNEWEAACLLRRSGFKVPTPVAFGERRKGFKKMAFTLFKAAEGERLEDLFRQEPEKSLQEIVPVLAHLAGRFHRAGFAHQDFYLCHFFWDGKELTLIDLQRVRRSLPSKKAWVIKDLAELFYAAENVLAGQFPVFLQKFSRHYALFVPWIKDPAFLAKIGRKKAKIARHDAKLKARLSFKRNGRK